MLKTWIKKQNSQVLKRICNLPRDELETGEPVSSTPRCSTFIHVQ